MSAKLTATKNYDLFDLTDFNRDVKKIKKLEASMKKHGYIPAYPLHCTRKDNGRLSIKAGHHRFDVAKSLGLPVFYVVCEDTSEIPELEASTNYWKFNDYLVSHCRMGSKPHLLIAEYVKITGISPSQVASMLAGGSASSANQNKRVVSGTFEVKSTEHLDAVVRLVLGCKEMGIKFATQQVYVSALSAVTWLPEFDAATFLHRAAKNPGMCVKQATMDGCLTMIETVYNRQSKNKIALAFLAREAARMRAAVKKHVR